MRDRSWTLLQFTALCAALGAMTATAHAQAQGSWVMKAPLPAALNEVAVAAVGGKIHVMGGSVLGVTGPYHQEYDPATDKWRARAPLPRRLDHMGTAVLNGKIYAVGGFVGGGVHKDGQNAASEYDPATDTWRILAPMKAGRGSVGVAALDGKMHAIGGRSPDRQYGRHARGLRSRRPIPGRTSRRCRRRATTRRRSPPRARSISPAAASAPRPSAPTCSTSTIPRPTPGPPARRCRRRAAGLPGAYYKGLFMVLGGEVPPSRCAPTPRTKPTIPRPTPGARSRRCRPAGTRPRRRPTATNVYLAGGSLKPGGGGVTDQLIVFTMP